MTPIAQPIRRTAPEQTKADLQAPRTTPFGPRAHKGVVAEIKPLAGPRLVHAAPAPVYAIDGQGALVLDLPLAATRSRSLGQLLRDAAELYKVKVVALVVVTAWGGYHLGALQAGKPTLALPLLEVLGGIGLVSAGAGALNEVMERKTDALMHRTAHRPMAADRISLPLGLSAALGALLLGALGLHLFSNGLTALLALLTALVYTLVYTPLKRRTRWATFLGAFPGAMGPMLGWTAAQGRIAWPAVALFAILFVWQFPHFMSIAWLYRADYARAGIRMLPVVQPDGVSTVVVSLLHAALMIPVSLLPVLLGTAGVAYALPASALGLVYLAATIRFARILKPVPEAESRRVARELLKVSVLYLPLLFAALIFGASRMHG